MAKSNRLIRFLKFRILHVDDSPHRIALGAAAGLFVAWTPLLGVHILMAWGLSFVLRANKLVSLLFVWVSNPFTLIAIYYPNYVVGRMVVAGVSAERKFAPVEAAVVFEESFTLGNILSGFGRAEFWHRIGDLFAQFGFELAIGGAIIGGAVATVGYFVTYRLVIWYRSKHPHRTFQSQL